MVSYTALSILKVLFFINLEESLPIILVIRCLEALPLQKMVHHEAMPLPDRLQLDNVHNYDKLHSRRDGSGQNSRFERVVGV